MRVSRFYCPELIAEQTLIDLPEEVHRHAVQVLRLKKGDLLRMFDGKGLEVEARLIDIQKRQSQAEIQSVLEPVAESPLETVLLQGISRGERMDYAIQKAVELGVTTIIPVQTEYCNVQLNGQRADKKVKHWHGVMISACEQSGRSTLPTLQDVVSLDEVITQTETEAKLILDPLAQQSIADVTRSSSVALCIGPEGGFSQNEIDRMNNAGFMGVKFGPRILRTETASVAGLAVLQSLWGDLS
jgi:16S rRNA (uracil1498-N3)-methyltransferase